QRKGRRTPQRATSTPSVTRLPSSSTSPMVPRPKPSMVWVIRDGGLGGGCSTFCAFSDATGVPYSTCPHSRHKQSLWLGCPPSPPSTPGIQARAPAARKGVSPALACRYVPPPFSPPFREKRSNTHGDPTQGRRRSRRVLHPVQAHARPHHPRDGRHQN